MFKQFGLLISVLGITISTAASDKDSQQFRQSVKCFSNLVKKIDKEAGTFQYYTLPQTFVFPKSFLIDGDVNDQGFFLVRAESTKFCPFNFSVPTFGVKKSVRSKFKLEVDGQIYSMTYDHKARQFSSEKSLISNLMNRMPASTNNDSLKCEDVITDPNKPLNQRISWLIQRYGETFHREKSAGKRVFKHKFKALLKPCNKIAPQIDTLIQKFPGKKPKESKYSQL